MPVSRSLLAVLVLLPLAACGAFGEEEEAKPPLGGDGGADALADAPPGMEGGADAGADALDPKCEVYENTFAELPDGGVTRDGGLALDLVDSPGSAPPSLRSFLTVLQSPSGNNFPTAYFERDFATKPARVRLRFAMQLGPLANLYAELGCRVRFEDGRGTQVLFKHGGGTPALALTAKGSSQPSVDLLPLTGKTTVVLDLRVTVTGTQATAAVDVKSDAVNGTRTLPTLLLEAEPQKATVRCGINYADNADGTYEIRLDDLRVEVCER